MAKGAYIGIGGAARKVKALYEGVSGAARKVKKAYIGVGGAAREWWTAAPIVMPERFTCNGRISGYGYQGESVGSNFSVEIVLDGAGVYRGTVTTDVTMMNANLVVLSGHEALGAFKQGSMKLNSHIATAVIGEGIAFSFSYTMVSYGVTMEFELSIYGGGTV